MLFMTDKTTEFSFVLKPSDHGVGVFATHEIKEGTYLRLFGNEDSQDTDVAVFRKKEEVREFLRDFCVDRGELLSCPKDFGCMEIGWFMNHSNSPNAYRKDKEFYALRDIFSGEEITIDYNSLEEPEEAKEPYYGQITSKTC